MLYSNQQNTLYMAIHWEIKIDVKNIEQYSQYLLSSSHMAKLL